MGPTPLYFTETVIYSDESPAIAGEKHRFCFPGTQYTMFISSGGAAVDPGEQVYYAIISTHEHIVSLLAPSLYYIIL